MHRSFNYKVFRKRSYGLGRRGEEKGELEN